MGIILDLVVIAVIGLTVFFSAKHGFVRTVIEVAGFIAAVLLATYLSTPLANFTYNKYVEPSIVSTVEKASSDGTTNAVDAIWNSFPGFLKSTVGSFGVTKDSIQKSIGDSASTNISTAAVTASQTVAKPVVIRMLTMLFSVILLMIFLFLVRFIAKWVNKLFSIHIAGKINQFLGGILGLFKGIVIAALFCTIVNLAVTFFGKGFLCFTPDAIEDSYIFRNLADLLSIFR